MALGLYGFVATLQPDAHFGRILAAYGGVFVAGSLLWGVVVDGFRPDRWDVAGALVCLVGVALVMYAPRGGFFARNGKEWAVENEGISPNIEVEDWPAEMAGGHDAQLEQAVATAMRR